MSNNKPTPNEYQQFPDAPLENIVILVRLEDARINFGQSRCLELEHAFNKLKHDAEKTKRTITFVQLHITPLLGVNGHTGGVLYTIQAQWIGSDELARLHRLQALQSQGQTPSGPALRGVN